MGKRKKARVSRGRVAVVEDSRDTLYSLSFMLQSLGFDTTVVHPSEAVASQLRRLGPEIVVVDMMAAGFPPLESVRRARQALGPEVRIVAITADAVTEDAAMIAAAGADAVVAKPYTIPDLQAALGIEDPEAPAG
ncbi:MAG: hypothetical protein Kow00109_05560 [Acidobacteriota bacterium]